MYLRLFSIRHWQVTIRILDTAHRGNVLTFACWGGVDSPSIYKLLFGIKEYLAEHLAMDKPIDIAEYAQTEHELRF